MSNTKLVTVIFLDKTKELPVAVIDSFQPKNADGSPVTVELAPNGDMSEQLADKLIKTYPQQYAIYDKVVHGAISKQGYKIAKNYRKPQYDNLFDKLTSDEKDSVIEYINGLIKARQPNTTAPDKTPTPAELLKARLEANQKAKQQ